MAYGDADRAYLLGADFGIDVTYSGTTVDGQEDRGNVELLPGEVVPQIGLDHSVLVATGSISPAQGSAITVDGSPYTVYDVREVPPDGRFTRVWLAT